MYKIPEQLLKLGPKKSQGWELFTLRKTLGWTKTLSVCIGATQARKICNIFHPSQDIQYLF